MNNFPSNLRFLWARSGLSREEFSHKFNIDDESLRNYLGGVTEPSIDELILLSFGFEVTLDQLLKADLQAREERLQAQNIRLLVLDVDGVMTDGGMYFGESGEELKKFDTKDGRAIITLVRSGIPVAFLSGGSRGKAIENRAKRLQVERVYVGTEPKTEILQGWLDEMGLKWEQVAYIGDDVNDKGVIAKVGLSACPSDAVKVIKEMVDFVLEKEGGKGAIREFVETFLLNAEDF